MPGWQKLIVCDGVTTPCNIQSFFLLIKNGITDLFLFSSLVVTFMLIVTGFRLLTSRGNPNALSDARKMLGKVVWGYVWIICAWLIVYSITTPLIKSEFNFFLK